MKYEMAGAEIDKSTLKTEGKRERERKVDSVEQKETGKNRGS